MNKKSGDRTAAVIEIGSSIVRMRISQLRRGEIETLDTLECPVSLGHEVFNDGKISFESLQSLSGILTRFSAALLGYGCKNVRVVSSTMMREAENRSFVSDQLFIHNQLALEILEYSEEKALICSEILRILQQERHMDTENALLAYIGTGSIGLSLYSGGAIPISQNIPIGSLKLHDAFEALQAESDAFYPVIEEYLNIIMGRVEVRPKDIQSIILTGPDLLSIAAVCGVEGKNGLYTISAKRLGAVCEEVRNLSYSAIARRFDISEEEAEILYTALFIYNGILQLTPNVQKLICPDIDICDALTRHMLIPGAAREYDMLIHDSAVASANSIAQKFNCHLQHARAVSDYAVEIFDKMKDVHGLAPRHRLILELAARLHSCGQYINVRTHNRCSFDLVKNLDIFGVTQQQILLTAFVSGYDELSVPELSDFAVLSLTEERRLEISKLVAIFRLANAMDKSKRQKLKITKIKITKTTLEIKADTAVDALLEKWAFAECAAFFREVFGLSPELTLRSLLLQS